MGARAMSDACIVPVRIEHIAVRRDRIAADVRLADERYAYTTPDLIASALERFPCLLRHACVNERGTSFGSVACRTSVPHLFEHMVIEEQVRRAVDESFSYIGKTRWVNRRFLHARVEVSYEDDLIALAAMRDAQAWLNAALSASFGT